MPRLTSEEWIEIRAQREAGKSFDKLSALYKVSKTAIIKRSQRDGWGDGSDASEEIRRLANEKVTGVVTALDHEKRSEAIDLEAERLAEVQRRHRDEPNAIRERLYAGLKLHKAATTKEEKQMAFEDLKAAKISSETLLNIHKAERQAWDMDYPLDVKGMTIEQLEEVAKGRLPR